MNAHLSKTHVWAYFLLLSEFHLCCWYRRVRLTDKLIETVFSIVFLKNSLVFNTNTADTHYCSEHSFVSTTIATRLEIKINIMHWPDILEKSYGSARLFAKRTVYNDKSTNAQCTRIGAQDQNCCEIGWFLFSIYANKTVCFHKRGEKIYLIMYNIFNKKLTRNLNGRVSVSQCFYHYYDYYNNIERSVCVFIIFVFQTLAESTRMSFPERFFCGSRNTVPF